MLKYTQPVLIIMKFLNNFFDKFKGFAPLPIRIILGIVLIFHGWSKLINIGGTTQFFDSVGIPIAAVFAVVVALLEFAGGILILIGLLTRITSLFLTIEFLVVLLLLGIKRGFTAQTELELFVFACSLALLLIGSGRLALAHVLMKKKD